MFQRSKNKTPIHVLALSTLVVAVTMSSSSSAYASGGRDGDSHHEGAQHNHNAYNDKKGDRHQHDRHGSSNVGPDILISSDECNSGTLGTDIPTWRIGEPVSGVTIDDPVWVDASGSNPAYCQVTGSMHPIDAGAPDIRFSVLLPAQWSRRYVQLGGGGQNGRIPNLTGGDYLARGWTVAGSDSGHQTGSDEWTLHDEALMNFGFMQLKKTRDAAQVLMRRAYYAEPSYSYFVGSSQGGREGVTVAQRYPNDYDGVFVRVPIVGLSTIQLSRALQRIQEIPLDNWVTPAKSTAIATEVIRQCDGMDGLIDGIVNNYIACRANFNGTQGSASGPWTMKRCPNGVDPNPDDDTANACLTDGQISTVEFTHRRYEYATPLAYGTKDFGMYLPGTDAGGNGTIQSVRYRGQEGAAPDAPIFRWRAYPVVAGGLYKDLTVDILDYVEGGDVNDRRKLLSQWLDSTNPNLNPFRAKGGKLIAYIGTFDTTASPGEQLDYYQSVLDRMGAHKVEDFARLYVIPNAGHGLSGSQFEVDGYGNPTNGQSVPNSGGPSLDALIEWVENGVAPDEHPVLTSNAGASLPLCQYPSYPHYNGGDTADAGSYSCETN